MCIRDRVHGALQHRVLIAEVLSLGHGQVHNQVHRTTVERRHQRGGILIDLQRHAVHLGTFAPVVAELFQYDVFLHTARNIPERPGADVYKRQAVWSTAPIMCWPPKASLINGLANTGKGRNSVLCIWFSLCHFGRERTYYLQGFLQIVARMNNFS